jgi:hypothetical protein
METVNFSDHKKAILKALNEKASDHGITEPNSLIDGFINQPIYNELTSSQVIWLSLIHI